MYSIAISYTIPVPEQKSLDNVAPGSTLLELLLENNIPLNHECGGICSCATCHIYIDSGNECLEEMYKREKDFLKKAINPKNSSRLACQCLLLPGHGKIEITIPPQS